MDLKLLQIQRKPTEHERLQEKRDQYLQSVRDATVASAIDTIVNPHFNIHDQQLRIVNSLMPVYRADDPTLFRAYQSALNDHSGMVRATAHHHALQFARSAKDTLQTLISGRVWTDAVQYSPVTADDRFATIAMYQDVIDFFDSLEQGIGAVYLEDFAQEAQVDQLWNHACFGRFHIMDQHGYKANPKEINFQQFEK